MGGSLTSLILLSLAVGLGLMVAGVRVLIFRRSRRRWGATAVIVGFALQLWWVLLLAAHFFKSAFLGQDT
jgi:urea transporter